MVRPEGPCAQHLGGALADADALSVDSPPSGPGLVLERGRSMGLPSQLGDS